MTPFSRAVPLLAALAAACAIPGTSGNEPGPLDPSGRAESAYDRGLLHLAEGAFPAADSALRVAASRCPTTGDGPAALLLLASLHQDPRNPAAHPDSAAVMAARYLSLPVGTSEGRRLAEGLYVQALDRGADPGLRPAGPWPVDGEGRCQEPSREGDDDRLTLPVLTTTPYAHRLRELEARLDSLRGVHGSVHRRVGELEAELARIRRLLQQPDTAAAGAPPGA